MPSKSAIHHGVALRSFGWFEVVDVPGPACRVDHSYKRAFDLSSGLGPAERSRAAILRPRGVGHSTTNVRFGSNSEVTFNPRHVHFAPDIGH